MSPCLHFWLDLPFCVWLLWVSKQYDCLKKIEPFHFKYWLRKFLAFLLYSPNLKLICPFFFSCGSWNTWWNLNSTFAILHGHAIFDFGILFLVCGPSCLFGNPKSSVQKQSNLANNFSGWREKVSKNVIGMINYNLLL